MKCKCGRDGADMLFAGLCLDCYAKKFMEVAGYCKIEKTGTGWICPKCGYVWAIWVEGCSNCNQPTYEITTTDGTGDGTDADKIKP